MIPARMGSQRLKKKNLREINGIPLITGAIRKCKSAGIFDQIWVNSEDDIFGEIALEEGVYFHKRPSELANNQATSEQFISEFLSKVSCDFVVQVHSIAPLLAVSEVKDFVKDLLTGQYDCLLSTELIQIECAYKGLPVNFTFDEKTNSQDLEPIKRVSWSITGWKSETFLKTVHAGNCATYAGKVGYHPVSSMAGHVIKTERDLQIAEALYPLIDTE